MPDSILHIPAKATSVRLPGKNFADVGGRSSLTRVIEAALSSGCFDDIVVTGDDLEKLYRECGPYSVRVGPQKPSTVIQTTRDMIWEEYSNPYQGGALQELKPRHISIILPTLALVTADDIRGVFELSRETGDPVMAVSRFPYRMDEVSTLEGHPPDMG